MVHRCWRYGVVLLSCSICGAAQAEGFFIGLGIGGGDANVERPLFSSGDEFSFDGESGVVVGEVMLGYEFSGDAFVEVALQGYDSFEILPIGDAFDLNAVRAGVGYVFPGESRFRFQAKAGLSFWDLKARESILFNPGPEEVSRLDGTDLFVEGGLEYHFNDAVRAGVSLSYADFDFGSTTAIKLTVRVFP